MRTYVASKIHGIRVTDKSVEYHGSVSIGRDLMRAADIEQFEQVHVVNLNNGARWVTYAIEAEDGAFTLNGGGARLGEIGDKCVILTYGIDFDFQTAPVVFCNDDNSIREQTSYEPSN